MNPNWQGNIFKVEERIKTALETNFRTNVRFAFAIDENEPERKEYLHAHKLILALASEVFDRMFYGSLAENTDQDIVISDLPFELFGKMLKYIYTNSVDVDNFEDCMELFALAKTYMLHALENYCLGLLIQKLTVENALQIYDFAVFHEIEVLSAPALELIRRNTKDVINSPFFYEINTETLLGIVKQQRLKTNELELFLAVQSLALKKGAIQTLCRSDDAQAEEPNADLFAKFKEIVKQIRFLGMTNEEFVASPAFSALLTSDEALSINACLTRPQMIHFVFPNDFCQSQRQKPLPHVFFDIVHYGRALGRIVMELRTDVVPKTAERFRDLCVGQNPGYKGSTFWKVSDESCCGKAINLDTQMQILQTLMPYKVCEPENFILKNDSVGVLGACRKYSLQQSEDHFYITFQEMPSYDNEHVVFGKVVEGLDVLNKIRGVSRKYDVPLKDVIIKNCGEL